MTQTLEELREALQLQYRLRQQAEAGRREAELMLKAMQAILEAADSGRLYEQIFALFSSLLDYQHALILEKQADNSLRCVAATDEAWLDQRWPLDQILQRALEGEPVAVVSARRQPAWQQAINDEVGALLYGPFSSQDREALLVFIHPQPGFYLQQHVQLLRRYTRLTRQARLSFEAKLQALQSDELQRAKERAEQSLLHAEKMVSLGTLAAGVAHEINNPVGFISSNMQYIREFSELSESITQQLLALLPPLLKNSDDNASAASRLFELLQQEEYLERCQELADVAKDCSDGLNRIKDLINGLRTFSRQDDSVSEPIDIHQCVQTTLRMVNNELKYHCTVNVQLQPTGQVLGASGQLNQVLTNLLVNAGHAIEQQGTVTVASGRKQWPQGWFAYVSVADTGKGIASKDLKHIFDPFFTTKEEGKGTGLGLAICHSIIEKMGGWIEVDSQVGEGTRFTLWLPESAPPV